MATAELLDVQLLRLPSNGAHELGHQDSQSLRADAREV